MIRFFLVLIGTILAVGLFYRLTIASIPGAVVTSWWRTPTRNREVGGVSASLHLLGLAWDVIPPTTHNAESLRALGLHVIDEGTHLHAQFLF